ncbi:RNA polymerase sigma factor [Streptomyces sp. ISL-11]|uniref:RNA polymerase sigma factor n=1 Tax=Streptomyces sp. ISL-11 TaxID=2819174 RepID=UPI001BE7E7DA|nr:sigma-70 family RNA polymerase sigma factor [Streptomyces sp. ISL-11]MBT2382997.1 sigma-70 family RNA polymerase sigma factor [Streptomyces sp. ISL-11]
MQHRRGPDGNEFDRFFRSDYRKLIGFLRFIGATKEEAEDSASAAMIYALECWAEITHPFAWVRKAAERHFLRSTARDLDAPKRALKGGWAVGAGLPGHEVPSRADEEAVLALMRNLGYKQRQVIAYTYDGFNPSEIAEITGDLPATVRSNLRSARAKLTSILQESRATADTHGEEE